MTHAEKEVRNQKMVVLRKQGYSITQLAEMFDLNSKTISAICKQYGVSGVMSNRKRDRNKNQYTKITEDEKRKYVERYLPFGFSYDSGYTDCDSHVNILCNVCNTVFDASMISIRKGKKITCSNCSRADKEQKLYEQAKRKEELEIDRQKKKAVRVAERDAWAFLHTYQVECVECGKIFTTTKSRKKCCSTECTKHRLNRRHDRRIQKSKRIDKDITVKKLFERDNRVCWICGGLCDLDDYILTDKAIVCGDTYPSIDHIIPVCEGGEDAWRNVRLAHRKCNTMRYWGNR